MPEIWKDIDGYNGIYQVSNLGKVRKSTSLKPIAICLNTTGYEQVNLSDGFTRKKLLVHRLVAQAFIPNPNNLPQINHIDENKRNNIVSNLEWCDASYNNNYGAHNANVSNTKSTPVLCLENNEIFKNTAMAARSINVRYSAVYQAMLENRPCKGFTFIRL